MAGSGIGKGTHHLDSGELQGGSVWFERRGAELILGITNQALEKIGSVQTLELSAEGDEIRKGDIIATVEGTKDTLEILSPTGGSVDEVNEGAVADPERVTDDPMEGGWLIQLHFDEISDELSNDEKNSEEGAEEGDSEDDRDEEDFEDESESSEDSPKDSEDEER